ncbi:hypothetical protein D1007_38542 [Hordeum vulgare]|nr:hypothetical protein D1007_38542 [Hordeum vulgare]
MASGRRGVCRDSSPFPCPPFECVVTILGLPLCGASHYQIHALHLDPCSLILLSAFAFLCEAFVGVTPSVALLCHFFSLELASKMQCSGCAFLKVDDVSTPEIPSVELLPEAEGFRRQWVLVEATGVGALFQHPSSSAMPKRRWEREELSDPRLAPVLTHLEQLRRTRVSMAMVVHEFICRRISPLQRHSRLMWAYTGPGDSMWPQAAPFSSDVLHELLRPLTGGNPDELPPDGQPLYRLKALKGLTVEMPLFDEWGFLPEGREHSQGVVPPGVQPRHDPDRAAASRIVESLASREAKLEEEVDRRVAQARRSLLLDYRAKLKLQESRFLRHHDYLQIEVNALRRRLVQEMESRHAALDAQAIAEGKLSNICKQVKGTSSLVEEASEEATHAHSLQLERSKMFQSLEWRSSRALGDIYGEGVSGPLIPDDSGYLGFFCRVVERLEASVGKVLALVEEKSQELLG